MRVDGKSTRFNERRKLDIPVEVFYRENSDVAWSEDSRSQEVTICGVGLTLNRPVEPNHLINLRLPMPRQLRLFDYVKSLYDVWGIVRSVDLLHASVASKIQLRVGVALIGENPPASFLKDPGTLYDLNPVLMRKEFWTYRELPRNWRRYSGFYDSQQKVSKVVILETIGENGRIIKAFVAETQRASEGEMVLNAKLTEECSKFVVISKSDRSLSMLAKVRQFKRDEKSDSSEIHLEFISGEWII